jgi:hypothetical protein
LYILPDISICLTCLAYSSDPDRVGLHVGCTVKLHSLVAAPQHNGAEGELGGYDKSAGRWEVNLSTGGAALRVKPANLTFIQAKRSFFFAPTRRKVSNSKQAQESESEQLIGDAGAQSNSSVSEELLQEAFEQVIGELGPRYSVYFLYWYKRANTDT